MRDQDCSGELLRSPTHNGHLLVGALKRHQNKPVLFLGDTRLTGGQLADRISQYIQAFEALGAGTGVAVGLLSLNRPEVLMIIGAGQARGYRRTALHPLGSLADHAYVLNDAGISSLIIDPNPMFVERALALLEQVDSLQQILTIGPVPDALKHVAVDLSAEAAKYQPQPLVAADLPPDQGEMIVLAKFDPAEVLRIIEEQRITATMLVPSMLYALLDHPDSHTRDLSSLETVYYGASAINPVRIAEAIRRFGPIFAQYYGQSEAPMVITYLAKGDHDEKRLTSCGRPTLFARVALLDEHGKPVKQGEVGEICVSGPLLAGGYWNLPDETSRTFKDGWLHTGDLAREDSDGFYYIVDRVKDMIVTGGFNVFPREVEDVVAEHPAVAQVCVVGAPDEKWGEAVTAVVVLRSNAARDEPAIEAMTAEIQAAVKQRKGSVQAPKRVVVVDSLPLTGLGKPDKKAVRARFWEGAGRAVG